MGPMEDRWMSVDELAACLGVSNHRVYTWASGPGMPGHKVGRYWKLKKDEVDGWARAARRSQAAEFRRRADYVQERTSLCARETGPDLAIGIGRDPGGTDRNRMGR